MCRRFKILGGDFAVEAADAALMQLVADAFGGLPEHRFDGARQQFSVRLVRSMTGTKWGRDERPPTPSLSSGAGLLCATLDAGNFAVIDTAMSRALISISSSMLKFRHVARHELVELTFLTLAARAQRLVPLHAACIGDNGAGILLMGPGGAGKSTIALQAVANGLQFLSEDASFVSPESLLITGASSFLHVQIDALEFLEPGALHQQIEASPLVQRRNGTRKLEVDVRRTKAKIAPSPLKLTSTVILSARPAGSQPKLRRLEKDRFVELLRREQPYARSREAWTVFESCIAALPSYELRRTSHPKDAIELLCGLLRSA